MRTLLASLAAAALGLSLAWVSFEQYEPDAAVKAFVTHQEAEASARQLAARYGVDTTGWAAHRQAQRNTRHRLLQERNPGAEEAAFFTTLIYQFRFVEPGGGDSGRSIRGEIYGTGRPHTFEVHVPAAGGAFVATPPTDAQQAAILADFAGPLAPRFVRKAQVDTANRGMVTTWELTNPRITDMLPRLEATTAGGRVLRAAATSVSSEKFDAAFQAQFGDLGLRFALAPILMALGISFTCARFFPALARKQLRWRPAANIAVATLASSLFAFFLGAAYVTLRFRADSWDGVVRQLLQVVAISLLMAAMWASGRAAAAASTPWQTLDWLLAGFVRYRRVGHGIAFGLLLGAASAGIPAALCRLGLARKTEFGGAAELAIAPIAWADAVSLPLGVDQWALLFLFLPVIPMRWPAALRALLLALVGGVLVAAIRPPLSEGLLHNIAAGALMSAVSLVALRYGGGLLSAACTALGWSGAVVTLILLHQPAAGLRASGFTAAALFAGLVLAAISVALFGRDGEPAGFEDQVPTATATAGQRLRAEFELARQAQQRFLPAVPERAAQFSLAAACHAAREVGGDLYDFFEYPDGTYGLCVADVSGKGVPAALYMTMTKGLLAAARGDTTDLAATASALNQHLYVAARRKTFVTMVLGRLTPQTAQLEFVRAGHNPVLLWRHAERSAQYLKPRGVGLGLSSGVLFDRALALHQLTLAPGDVVVFYSDGITEAMNPQLELFGEERLALVVSRNNGGAAADIQARILAEVREFMAGEPPHDDMTLLVLKA